MKKLPPRGSRLPCEVLADVKLDTCKLHEQPAQPLALVADQPAPLYGSVAQCQ